MPMLPGMVVLGIHVEHLGSQLQLMTGIVQELHNDTAMVPHLIVLRVVQDDALDVPQLLTQIRTQLLQDVPPVLPDSVIGRIQPQGILGQLQGPL